MERLDAADSGLVLHWLRCTATTSSAVRRKIGGNTLNPRAHERCFLTSYEANTTVIQNWARALEVDPGAAFQSDRIVRFVFFS